MPGWGLLALLPFVWLITTLLAFAIGFFGARLLGLIFGLGLAALGAAISVLVLGVMIAPDLWDLSIAAIYVFGPALIWGVIGVVFGAQSRRRKILKETSVSVL